jgi:hypothetical protein
MVSLRLTTTSMVEKPRLASCAAEGAGRHQSWRLDRGGYGLDHCGVGVARQRHECGNDRDQPELENPCCAGCEPGNGGLEGDRHDLYNVTHGSITGQSRRAQNVTAISNPLIT